MSDTTKTTLPSGAFLPGGRPLPLVRFPADLGAAGLSDTDAVGATNVDDDALAALACLANLVELSIMGSFTDAGLVGLAGLAKLEHLTVVSPNVTAEGLSQLAGTKLRSLSLVLPRVSTDDLVAYTTLFPKLTHFAIESPVLSIDHLLALQPLDYLERLVFSGGGDFLGGDDGELDPVTVRDLLRRYPALQSVHATWLNGSPLIGDHGVVAMMKARPGMAIDGTWYHPSVFDPGSRAMKRSDGEVIGDGEVLDVAADQFDATFATVPTAVVEFWSSRPGMCKIRVNEADDVSGSLEQLAPMLKERVTVARIDIHESNDLAERFNISSIPSLLVFKYGELVGRITAQNPTSILIQLKPVM